MSDVPKFGPVMTPAPGIAPLDALATSMCVSPGLFAILLGAGMSISAGRLCAWGILYDLIRQVAVSENTNIPEGTEENWWEQKTGERPHYGELIKSLNRLPQLANAGYIDIFSLLATVNRFKWQKHMKS